jgi:hypothetical protein
MAIPGKPTAQIFRLTFKLLLVRHPAATVAEMDPPGKDYFLPFLPSNRAKSRTGAGIARPPSFQLWAANLEDEPSPAPLSRSLEVALAFEPYLQPAA